MKRLLNILSIALLFVVFNGCNLQNAYSADLIHDLDLYSSRVSACGEDGPQLSFEETSDVEMAIGDSRISYGRNNLVWCEGISLKIFFGEIASRSISAKTGKISHHHSSTSLIRMGDLHSLQSPVKVYNNLVLGFSRSVDKYIYALRHIII